MGKIGHWIISLIGYGLYTIALVVLLLWFLFPTDSFRVWLERKLTSQNQSVTWKIQEVRPTWPLSLVAQKIEARDDQSGTSLMVIDSLKVRPDLGKLTKLPGTVPLVYIMKMYNGSVDGTIAVGKEKGDIKSTGEIDKVQINGLKEIWEKFGRPVSGDMSGTYSYAGEWKKLSGGKTEANLQLTGGTFGLRQPIMGLEALEFRQLDTSFVFENKVITIDQGKVESDLYAAEFAGTINLGEDLLGSDLDVKGWFEPRPELLSALKDQTMVRLIKSQLRNNRLDFSLTDTLMMPGILFEGASGVIDGLIQGGAR